MKKAAVLTAVSAAVILSGMTAIWVFCDRSLNEIREQQNVTDVYLRHFVLVDDDSSVQMDNICRAASEHAKESSVRFERIGENALFDYSMEDKMTIALAEKADGIILSSKDPDALTGLINQAQEEQVPVVTLLNDNSDSARVSYIGLNSYEIGDAYGRQVISALKDGENKILVLMDSDAETVQSNLAFSTILSVVEAGKKEGQKTHFSGKAVNSSGTFEAEEVIRDIFVSSDGVPDILVCLDSVTTECSIQAVTDYNRVGDVTIIGYYTSPDTLAAIPKGIVQATLSIDADEIAKMSVDALNEYLDLGYVSNYFPADFKMITKDNVYAAEG